MSKALISPFPTPRSHQLPVEGRAVNEVEVLNMDHMPVTLAVPVVRAFSAWVRKSRGRRTYLYLRNGFTLLCYLEEGGRGLTERQAKVVFDLVERESVMSALMADHSHH